MVKRTRRDYRRGEHRVKCLIPGCRRTYSVEPGARIMCGRCWKTVDPAIRQASTAAKRRLNGFLRSKRYAGNPVARDRAGLALWLEAAAAWRAVERDATIKAAMGASRL